MFGLNSHNFISAEEIIGSTPAKEKLSCQENVTSRRFVHLAIKIPHWSTRVRARKSAQLAKGVRRIYVSIQKSHSVKVAYQNTLIAESIRRIKTSANQPRICRTHGRWLVKRPKARKKTTLQTSQVRWPDTLAIREQTEGGQSTKWSREVINRRKAFKKRTDSSRRKIKVGIQSHIEISQHAQYQKRSPTTNS